MKFLTYILLFAFTASIYSSFMPYLDYKLNLEEIIENYCVNKDKPELHCEGKCHLKKLIKEQDKKTGQSQTKLLRKEIHLYWQDLNTPLLLFNNAKVLFGNPGNLYAPVLIQNIFHPPNFI